MRFIIKLHFCVKIQLPDSNLSLTKKMLNHQIFREISLFPLILSLVNKLKAFLYIEIRLECLFIDLNLEHGSRKLMEFLLV